MQAVLPQEKVGLVEALLPQHRSLGSVLERSVFDRAKRGEMRMVDRAVGPESVRRKQQVAVRLRPEADDELRSRSRANGGPRRTRIARKPAHSGGHGSGPHDAQHCDALIHALLGSDPVERRLAGGLQVEGHAVAEKREPLNLCLLRARDRLRMEISRIPVPEPNGLDQLQEPVHRPLWAFRNSRGDEEAADPATPVRGHEDLRERGGRERMAGKVPARAHRAVAAFEGARVREQDPEERRLAESAVRKPPDVDRVERLAGPLPRRELAERAVALLVGKRLSHQQSNLRFGIHEA